MNSFGHFRRFPWIGDQHVTKPVLTWAGQHRKMWTYIHASSGIRTHVLSVRAVQDHTSSRQRAHWDWL